MASWMAVLDIGVLQTDDHDQRLLKRLQTAMAIASVPVVAGWGATFVLMGHPEVIGWHALYCVGSVVLLLLLWATRRMAVLSAPHIVLVMVSPYGLHWMLGGYTGSGGAFLWCLLGPVAAMMFRGPRRALVWFAALIVALIAALGFHRPHILSESQITQQFTFNTVGFVAFLFLSTRYFVVRLAGERARSEKLLLNVLPQSIAERLKREEGVTIADRFDRVTVLFADIAGFTVMSQRMTPRDLVALLDEIFSSFDEVVDRFGLEKIKTIGDAYMLVGGLPVASPDHAPRVARAAFAMRQIVREVAERKGADLSMRIGIHSGEVVAGVIGRRKFVYDLWGDTVNTASRMESHGAPDRIHLSEAARDLLTDAFVIEERGLVEVKGKGTMRTFWLGEPK